MSKRIKLVVAVVILALFSVLSVKFVYDNREPAREWRILSISILPVTSRQAKLGYDTKVDVIIFTTGKEPPKLKNRMYVGGEIRCDDAHFAFSPVNVVITKILQQKPRVEVIVGSPVNGSTVSFLYNKEKLPRGQITLQGTIQALYCYNIKEPGKSGVETYNSPGVPVNIQIQ